MNDRIMKIAIVDENGIVLFEEYYSEDLGAFNVKNLYRFFCETSGEYNITIKHYEAK